MLISINIMFPNVGSPFRGEADIEEYCPHCGKEVMPAVIYSAGTEKHDAEYNEIAVLLRCPRSECRKHNVQSFSYKKSTSSSSIISNMTRIKYTFKPQLINDLPKEINETFTDFKSIYDQSLEAESLGLDQIAGIGFRKSLEFLIKSYALLRDPDSQSKIEKETLNNTIQNRYGDFPKIQKLAELAAWIGNDETHFVKKHTEIDINDMKKFLRSAALFIAADMDADFAATYIEENKK